MEIEDVSKYDANEIRPVSLPGNIYKLKSPKSGAAIYIAISRNRGRIFEIFFYSRNNSIMLHLSLLGRLLSAIFRRETEIDFLLEELRALWDIEGGYYSDGKYYSSIYSHIADIIESEMKLKGGGEKTLIKGEPTQSKLELDEIKLAPKPVEELQANDEGLQICPECNQKAMKMENGCMSCSSCGYSKCDH